MSAPRATDGDIRWAASQGSQIAYLDTGPAEAGSTTLVFLHGLGNSCDYWLPVIDHLAPRFRCIAVDMPGFGRSEPPRGGISMGATMGALAAVEAATGIDGAIYVGHSMGAQVAAARGAHGRTGAVVCVSGAVDPATSFLCRHRWRDIDPVAMVALIAQVLVAVAPAPRAAARLLRSSLVRTLVFWPFVAHPGRLPVDVARTLADLPRSRRSVTRTVRLGAHSTLTDLVTRCPVPVHLIGGDRDLLARPAAQRRLAAAASVVSCTVLEDCGHWPHIEQPGELAARVAAIARR